MANPIFETQLSDTLRVRAYVDETGYAANEVLGDTSNGSNGWFFMPKRGYYGALDYFISREHSDGKLSAEMLELAQQLSDFKSYDEIAEDLLKHANRAGYTAKKYELRGYMQSDYAEVIIYTLGDYGDGMAETLDTWFKGDIYTITLERLEVFISPTSGRDLNSWEWEDSIACILLETGSDDELTQIANSYFTYDETEKAA
jgi:hypothetical protein